MRAKINRCTTFFVMGAYMIAHAHVTRDVGIVLVAHYVGTAIERVAEFFIRTGH